MTIELANGFKVRALNAKKPLLNLFSLRLFVNQPTLSGDTVTADLTEPGGAWYTVKSASPWGLAQLLPDGSAVVRAQVIMWTWGISLFPGVQVFGYWFMDENGFYAFGDYFGNPVQMGGPGQGEFTFQPRLFEDTMR